MMNVSEIQLDIYALMKVFESDVSSDFIKGQIVALRGILGEDRMSVLDELHEIRRSVMFQNGEI